MKKNIAISLLGLTAATALVYAAGTAPVIIAEMQTELPICSVSGAVMRMDLADLPALMFRNSAHGGLNMVYRRPDGNIGWVDPKAKG